MSQTLLFVIGVGVFAITVVASLFYGYFTLDRIHQADEARGAVVDAATPRPPPDVAEYGSAPISSPAPVVGSSPASEVRTP